MHFFYFSLTEMHLKLNIGSESNMYQKDLWEKLKSTISIFSPVWLQAASTNWINIY